MAKVKPDDTESQKKGGWIDSSSYYCLVSLLHKLSVSTPTTFQILVSIAQHVL
jgi:hypothetical protein